MEHYHFLSVWRLDAPLQKVWDAVYASEQWPDWWKYVLEVKEPVKGDERGIGSIREYTFGSPLGYTFRFSILLREREELKLLKGAASGDLNGTGAWHFREDDGKAVAECRWDVSTNVAWMNSLAWLLAPLFRFNHSLVMRAGRKALEKRLLEV